LSDVSIGNCWHMTRLHIQSRMASPWIEQGLILVISLAYWIAFGPHGPRAVDPPGTNARIAWGVAVGIAASFAIFAAIRSVAKPEPHTMSKEYQEASNELLIVSLKAANPDVTRRGQVEKSDRLNSDFLTATKSRSLHWYHLRGLQWQGYGPVPLQGPLNSLFVYHAGFFCDRGIGQPEGDVPPCKTVLERVWDERTSWRGDEGVS
jgi:hypothetical protein